MDRNYQKLAITKIHPTVLYKALPSAFFVLQHLTKFKKCAIVILLKQSNLRQGAKMILPKNVPTDHYFMGSVFQNAQFESILRKIVIFQTENSPEKWIPFSLEEYCEFHNQELTENKQHIFNCLVNGGKPFIWETIVLDSGWLAFDEETKKYSFTYKMIAMLEKKFTPVAMATQPRDILFGNEFDGLGNILWNEFLRDLSRLQFELCSYEWPDFTLEDLISYYKIEKPQKPEGFWRRLFYTKKKEKELMDEYNEIITHVKKNLDAFVSGSKPLPSWGDKPLESGLLNFNPETLVYSISEKMIKIFQQNYRSFNEEITIKPRDVPLIMRASSYGNPFGLPDCTYALRNMLLLQKRELPDEWSSFTWEDYSQICNLEDQKYILELMVTGGKHKIHSDTIEGGWLIYNGTEFLFSDKLIHMIQRYYC